MYKRQEKFTFLYVALAAVALTCAIAYSLFAGLSRGHMLLLLIGAVVVASAFVFNYMELRKVARRATGAAEKEFEDPYAPRKVELKPPTGDAYPHHEHYTESAGFDQSQLTARIPGSTPFIDDEPVRDDEPAIPGKAKAR